MEKPRYDVFLSHATADKPVVEELARQLKGRGFEPWLDKWNLIPGEPWQEAIEKALEDCAACAVCLGPSGTGPWQNEEMRVAIDTRVSDRSRAFRVIPVLLPRSERGEPSRLPAFLRATTWVEFRDTLEDEKALHRLVCGLQGIPPGTDPGEAVAEGAQPYRGLQVFDVGDALFFFGREALTEWLLDKLRTDRTGNRFLAIVGPSGSGKSSLARAGLLAALKRGEIPGSDTWPAAICKPGAQPLESLAVALSGAARLGDSPSALRALIHDLGADPRMLHLTARLSLRDAPADRRLVVLVDQFEEIFTLCPDEPQRQAIIANLLHAATAADGQTVVVLTLRADFYGRCAAYPDLATAVSDRQSLVGPMTRHELRSAIERPAYLAGCELEGGLTDLLLNEVESQPGSLPLLEHALLQIWQRREGGRRLTIAAYGEIGGMAGALEKHAETVYSGFTEDEKEACRRVFLRLVQVGEQGRATKRRLNLDELEAATVIAKLTDSRLLTTDQEKRPTVEVAHEALLANWDRLKQWIDQDRDALRTRRRLDEAVAEWLGKDRDPAFLLEGGRLVQAEEWARGHAEEKNPERRELLAASVAARDRGRRRQRGLTIAAGVIAVVALMAAVKALSLWHGAENQRRLAVASELSERSRTAFASDPQLGLLLATQAIKMARDAGEPYLPVAQSALRWALSESGGIPLSSGPVRSVFMTPDRRTLVTLGKDRHVRLWNLGEHNPPFSSRDLGELPEGKFELSGSATGDWLLVGGEGGSSLLDLKISEPKLSAAISLKGEDWLLGNKPFSADGRWLVTRNHEDLWLRDLRSRGRSSTARILRGQGGSTYNFSPDHHTLATASMGGLVKLWDLQTPGPSTIVGDLHRAISALDFSPDGQALIATAPPASVVTFSVQSKAEGTSRLEGCVVVERVVQRGTGVSVLCLSLGEKSQLWSYQPPRAGFEKEADWPFGAGTVDFSPDGFQLAMGDFQGKIYLQPTHQPEGSPEEVTTQAAPAKSVLFAASSRWLLTQGGNEAPRLWDLSRPLSMADFEPKVFRSPRGAMQDVTAKGEILREDPASHKFRLWKLSGVPASQELPGSDKARGPRAVSSNGQWIAAAAEGESLLLWQLMPDGGVAPPIVLSSESATFNLGFSPGDRWLAAAYSNGDCRLWDLNDPKATPHSLTNLPDGGVMAFAPGDDRIATAGWDDEIHLRVLDDKGPRTADSPHHPKASFTQLALAFSADGEWLAVGGLGNRIRVWKASGHEVFLEERSGTVGALAFSPDGRWLAAGGEDGTVQLWRWAGEKTNSTPIVLAGQHGIDSVVFTPQGLLSSSRDGTVRLWELRTGKLIKLACQSAGRTLSRREWDTYLLSETYEQDEPCPGMPKAPD